MIRLVYNTPVSLIPQFHIGAGALQLILDLKADYSPIIHSLFKGVQRTIKDTIPDVDEVVLSENNEIGYTVNGKDCFIKLVPLRYCVRLRFTNGAHFPDPQYLLKGTTKHLSYVEIDTMIVAKSPALQEMIRQALAEELRRKPKRKS